MMRILSQSRHKILGMLMLKGFDMKSFALSRGYEPATVRQVVRRYAEKANAKPVGEITKNILQDLEATLFETDETTQESNEEPGEQAHGR